MNSEQSDICVESMTTHILDDTNIFKFSSSVMVFHKVLIALDSISILKCIFYVSCRKL
jgi:hypothetical protein